MPDIGCEVLNVTPFAGASVLEPEAANAKIWGLSVPADREALLVSLA